MRNCPRVNIDFSYSKIKLNVDRFSPSKERAVWYRRILKCIVRISLDFVYFDTNRFCLLKRIVHMYTLGWYLSVSTCDYLVTLIYLVLTLWVTQRKKLYRRYCITYYWALLLCTVFMLYCNSLILFCSRLAEKVHSSKEGKQWKDLILKYRTSLQIFVVTHALTG